MIQIVLVGQPELADMLSRPNLRQLNQRIVVRCRLESLDTEETSAYILHRLKVAGRADGALFTPDALREIYRCSDGFPRMINIICDRALLSSYAESRGQVTPHDVRLAFKEITGVSTSFGQSAHRSIWLAILARVRSPIRRSSY